MKWIQRAFYVGMVMIGFVIAGATSILTQDVWFEAITDPAFYVNQLLTDVSIVFIIYGVLYACVDGFTETNEQFLLANKNINDFAVSKDYIPTIFGRFLEDLNYRRKEKQYEFDIKKKLARLDEARQFPRFWKRKYGERDFFVWWHGTDEQRLSNEYCRKRQELEIKLSREYIDKNLKQVYVKYDKVTTDIVLSGAYRWSKRTVPNDFIEKHATSKVILHKLPAFLLAFGFMFFASSLVFGAIKFDWSALISFCSKLISLIWNMLITLRYAKKYCNETVLKDTLFRNGIVVEYKKWLVEEAESVMRKDRSEIAALKGSEAM